MSTLICKFDAFTGKHGEPPPDVDGDRSEQGAPSSPPVSGFTQVGRGIHRVES